MTRDGRDWYWFSKHNMKGKFYGMYMIHPANKHVEQAEENKGNIYAYKMAGPRE